MLRRKAPLQSGTDTEIDLIERQMEGGVMIEQPAETDEKHVDSKLGGLVEVEEHVQVRKLNPKGPAAPKG